jgi:hypothetical protein
VRVMGSAVSMRRGESEGSWEQRRSLLEAALLEHQPGAPALLAPSALPAAVHEPTDAAPSTVDSTQRASSTAAAPACNAALPVDAELATTIGSVLSSCCRLSRVGADVPLMEAGLDSSDLARFGEALGVTLKVALPATLVLECGTIRAMASRLSERRLRSSTAHRCASGSLLVDVSISSPAGRHAGVSRTRHWHAILGNARDHNPCESHRCD